MRKVMLTVTSPGAPHGLDLEVPTDLPAGRLAALIAPMLEVSGGRQRLEAFPPGRVLREEETLAGAGIWDGAWLILHLDE